MFTAALLNLTILFNEHFAWTAGKSLHFHGPALSLLSLARQACKFQPEFNLIVKDCDTTTLFLLEVLYVSLIYLLFLLFGFEMPVSRHYLKLLVVMYFYNSFPFGFLCEVVSFPIVKSLYEFL
jgi:hypothetical protein